MCGGKRDSATLTLSLKWQFLYYLTISNSGLYFWLFENNSFKFAATKLSLALRQSCLIGFVPAFNFSYLYQKTTVIIYTIVVKPKLVSKIFFFWNQFNVNSNYHYIAGLSVYDEAPGAPFYRPGAVWPLF